MVPKYSMAGMRGSGAGGFVEGIQQVLAKLVTAGTLDGSGLFGEMLTLIPSYSFEF